jgi:hypothetical protein
MTIRRPGRTVSSVPLFVIERNFEDGLDLDALDFGEIRLVNDDVGVNWVYSFLSADKKKTYCLYEAPSAEAIRAAAERLGIPADVIVPVEQFGPVAAG